MSIEAWSLAWKIVLFTGIALFCSIGSPGNYWWGERHCKTNPQAEK